MFSIYLVPLIIAMFLAINMGGSGTSAAFSSAYGANLIRKDLIPGLFGAFVLLGAIIAGKEVTLTVGKGIVPDDIMGITVASIILLAIGLSMLLANLLKVPQSTSQSTVFALIGVGIYFGNLKIDKVLYQILPSWIAFPIVAFLITLLVGKLIYKPLKDRSHNNFETIKEHPVLKMAVIVASCYVAFAIGANNVANASGPIMSLLSHGMDITSGSNYMIIMILATLIIAPCFGIGSSIFGSRVLETTGKEIIIIGPLGAMLISLITGSLLIFASVNGGIPAALAQLNVGAIIGLGCYKVGFKNILQKSAVKRIFFVWFIAPIIAFLLAYGMCYVSDLLNLL